MKKDYSKRNLINAFGMNLPNIIGNVISLIISLPILFFTDNTCIIFLVIGFCQSFIGLSIAGKLLDKNCTNEDYRWCHGCKNWNCKRGLR